MQNFPFSGETAAPNPQDKLKFIESNENAECKSVYFLTCYVVFIALWAWLIYAYCFIWKAF